MALTFGTLERFQKLARSGPPPGIPMYPGCTPVPFFGQVTKAVVLTVTLNPATDEFSVRPERFPTLNSLGRSAYNDLNDADIQKQAMHCSSYFERNPNPWFEPLERLVQPLGLSYKDDRARRGHLAHVDISPWCTTLGFGLLKTGPKETLRANGADLLFDLIAESPAKALLVNGSGAHGQLISSLRSKKIEHEPPRVIGGVQPGRLDLYRGELRLTPERTIRILAWSPFLQRGSTGAWVDELAPRIAAELKPLL